MQKMQCRKCWSVNIVIKSILNRNDNTELYYCQCQRCGAESNLHKKADTAADEWYFKSK